MKLKKVALAVLAGAVVAGPVAEMATATEASAGTTKACYMVAKEGWLTYFDGAPETKCFGGTAKMHAAEQAAGQYPVATAAMPGAKVEFVVPRAKTCYYKYGQTPWSIDNLPDGVVNVRPIPGSFCDLDYTYYRLHYQGNYRAVYADTPLADNPSSIHSVLFGIDFCKAGFC